ncbi:MAG: heat-inducible transcriptional repressor HrcA, partial [Deferribacterales bacterium]
MDQFLNEREQIVLKMIVEEYIRTSEPVGSRYISKYSDLGLSPASIRNVMSDLEDKNMIKQTYISSGRIPSDLGFRYYVEKLITYKPFDRAVFDTILRNKKRNVKTLFEKLTQTLSDMTNTVSFVVFPKLDNMYLKHIEFIRLNKENILAVIVTKAGIVHNVILEVDQSISDGELVAIANFLNEHFKDKSLMELKNYLFGELKRDRERIGNLYDKLKKIGSSVFQNDEQGYEVVIHGLNHIVDQPEFKRDVDNLKNLLDIFESKQKMLQILNKLSSQNSVKIFIGSEIGEAI